MSIELVVGGANLFALIGYFVRTEGRLSKLETLVELLIKERGK